MTSDFALSTRIILVRHGQTDWNVSHRLQGHMDIGLNAQGYWQARQIARVFRDESIDAIYSSNLERAQATAHAIAGAIGCLVCVQPDLRERHFGGFEGHTFAEIESRWPDEARAWRQRDPQFAPPGGESLAWFQQRVLTCVHALAQRHVGEHIVLVAHGGVLDVLYREATGQSLNAPRTWSLENTTINRLLWSAQGFSLVGWGDARHLDPDIQQASAS